MAIEPNVALGVTVPKPPDALGMAGQFMGLQNAQAQNKLLGIAADTNQQALAGTQQKALGVAAMSVLHLPDDQIVHGLHDTLDRLVANGVVPQTMAQGWMDNAAKSNDPVHLRQMIAQVGLQAMDPAGQFTQIYGANASMSNGQQVQPGRTNSPFMQAQTGAPGFVGSGGAVTQFPSLSELNQRVPVAYDAKGNVIQGPVANVTPQAMRGPVAGTLGTGRYNLPPGLQGPGGGDTSLVTAPGAAASAALTETGGSGAKSFADISQQGVQAKQRDALWANAMADVSKFVPGKGADATKNFQAAIHSLARTFGLDPEKLGLDVGKIGSQEAFDKLMAQVQNQSGAGSDARMAIVQTGTPSASLTPDGLRKIFAQLRGNEQYTMARQQLAAQYPDKADAQGFEASIGKNLDPRAFQFSQIDPKQRAEFLKSFGEADQQAIMRAYKFAQQKGLLNGGR